MAEMITMRTNGRVAISTDGSVIFFDHMRADVLSGMEEHVASVAKGQKPKAEDKFKFGWVGFRSSDTYDQPGLWGFEYRSVASDTDPKTTQKLLDSLQYGLVENDYGISKTKFKEWQKENPGGSVADLCYDHQKSMGNEGQGHWVRPKELFNDTPKALKDEVDKIGEKAFQSRVKENNAVLMLTHNWDNDTLVFDQPELKKKIRVEQIKALQALKKLKDSEDSIGVMKDFIEQSGLYDRLAESFKIK